MRKVIHAHKEIFGKAYGIWVILANLYFLLIGASWFIISLIYLSYFNFIAFLMMLVFLVQLLLRRKVVNVILGIITLFFSLWQFIEVLTFYPKINGGKGFYENLFIGGIAIFALGIAMSFVLIFSYLKAFKKSSEY